VKLTRSLLRSLLLVLLLVFCSAYPIAVIGVAFDVQPPFSLSWAASALLFLEGTLVLSAAMLVYDPLRALLAALIVIVLSYLVETLGVTSGFPFGAYHYTDKLFPHLPGAVPLAVMFAWLLIVFGAIGWVKRRTPAKRGIDVGAALLGAVLATLLDLAIEPVAAHVVYYWQWLEPGPLSYYGVPLANFAAWFMVSFVLLLIVAAVMGGGHPQRVSRREEVADVRGLETRGIVARQKVQTGERGEHAQGMTMRLAVLAPRAVFGGSLFMFGLVDLTHGYYWAALLAVLGGILCYLVYRRPFHSVPPLR